LIPTPDTVGTTEDRVVIVGGGVIGVCCAYFLAKAGVSVVLLEAKEIASGCSYGNLGLLAASHSAPLASPGVISKALRWMFDNESPFAIHLRADPQLAAWLWRFYRASRPAGAPAATAALLQLVLSSMAVFDELSKIKDCAFTLEKRGAIELFSSAKGFAAAAERVRSLRSAGLSIDVLNPEAARMAEPLAAPGVHGALVYHDDWHLEPAGFVRALASLARRAGAKIQTHTRIVSFQKSGDHITGIFTQDSFIPASKFILAAGSFSPQLAHKLGIRLPVQPARGYSFTMPGSDERFSRPIMFSESKALLTPLGTGLRLGGVLELTHLDSPLDTRRANALINSIPQYLSLDVSFAGIEPWSGYRPCSPDGFPIVGWSHRWRNLLYASGHGMLGLTLGPLTGDTIASLVMGMKPNCDMTRMLPSRFGLSL
jgi:D-amino-acid dehydrogenase